MASTSTPETRASTPASRPATGGQVRRQLNAWDSAFLYMDTPATPMYGGFLHIYAPVKGDTSTRRFERLLSHVEHCIDAIPVFRRTIEHSPLGLDHAWFVEGAEVDLAYHVRHHALPEPGNDLQLNEMYARIAVQPMDISRPLWELHVIDGLNAVEGAPKNSFAMFMKVHHAAVDGKSAAEMTAALHRTTPDRDKITRLPAHRHVTPPPAQTLGDALLSTVNRYADLTTAVGRELAKRLPAMSRKFVQRLTDDVETPKDGLSVPQTIFNIEVSADRCYTHLSLPLAEIKELRQHVDGATVNDIYVAVVGGALRQYLGHHGALPEKSLVVGITVDVRPEADRGKGGNHVALIRVPLRTDEPDAVRRLQRIVEATGKAKSSLNRGPSQGTGKRANWPRLIPAPMLWLLGGANRLGLTARVKPVVNLGATNVPGPREVLYLDGARLIDFNGAPPFFHGAGLVINATSYDNALRVSVTSCRKSIPDPEFMRECLLQSFDELKRGFAKPVAARKAVTAVRKPKAVVTTLAKKTAAKTPPKAAKKKPAANKRSSQH